MRALGRLLQIIGWLWVAAGLFGPMIGYEGVNVLPGIILIFVARVIRRQAARHAPAEPDEDAEVEQELPERMLNTERATRTPPPPPQPVVRYQEAEEQMAADFAEPAPAEPETSLIDRIAGAGRELADEISEQDRPATVSSEDESRAPMSSAEMIARAHERWNRRR